MNIPRNHHYSPVFYLNQWTGADGKLCEHRHVSVPGQPDRVFTRRTFPAGTGYEKNLYRVDGVPEHLAQAVESKFMHMVDTEAKYVLNKIVSGDKTPWDPRMRSAWTRFILSLRFRNPEAVHVIKQQTQIIWNETANGVKAKYDKLRQPTDPPAVEEFMASTELEASDKAALDLLLEP